MCKFTRTWILAAIFAAGFSPATAATVSYWNVFNVEGESQVGADIVTYATLTDMLSDANRTGVLTLDGAGVNVVGSGAWASESPVIIPIPASFLLLASAFAGFAGHRMRRQHK